VYQDLQNLQESYATLEAEYRSLKEGYATLEAEYQNLRGNYRSLLETNTETTPEELIKAKEEVAALESEVVELNTGIIRYEGQISSLDADKSRLNSRLSETRIENARLEASLNDVEETITELTELIGKAEAEKDRLNMTLAQLNKQLSPSPDHAVTGSQIWGNPEFRSTDWQGRDYELQSKIEEIGRSYHRTHTYIPNETDCNDMAVDLWNMLFTENIKAVMVIGNLDKVGETFLETKHAWLYIFDAEGKIIYLEATTGEVLYGFLPNGKANPRVVPYREGFIYKKPSNLWADLKKRW